MNFSDDVLKNVTDFLQWFSLNDEHPSAKKQDGCVRMLAYCCNGDMTPIGYVARRLDGTFWNFTNNPDIYCRGYTGVYFTDADECAAELFRHVLPEVCRFLCNSTDFGYFIMSKFKKRDAIAFTEYRPNKLSEAFKAGADWILRSEGVARRPSWAQYKVQNRDGSFTWFEDKPSVNHNKGIWESKSGRSQKVCTHESWSASLTKVS